MRTTHARSGVRLRWSAPIIAAIAAAKFIADRGYAKEGVFFLRVRTSDAVSDILALLHELVLHHANFVIDVQRRPSSDPSPKLAQLDAVRRCFDEKDAAAFGTLAGLIAADASLAKYRERHFPDPEAWAALP